MASRFGAGYHRVLRRILLLVVLLIIYGSLYPWHFAAVPLAANPFWILLHSWRLPAFRYFLRDAIVNVVLYIPLGFSAHMVLRKSRLPDFALYGPVLLGLLLSIAMELTQLLVPHRDTSMADVVTNVTGSALGVMAALLFEALASRRPHHTLERRVADRGALFLAFCWVAYLFFPLFPVLSVPVLSGKLTAFQASPVFEPMLLLSAAASWYAAGLLLAATGVGISRAWFSLTLLAIPAQFFIVERQPLPSWLIGAILGVVFFAARRRTGPPTKFEAWTFLSVIVVRGLSPFHISPVATNFNWIPFEALLESDWQSVSGTLIEKIFYYGAAIWLLRAAGLTRMRSVTVTAVVLALIEMIQTRLPGRTPEITDPILAILTGFALAMLSRPARGAFIPFPETEKQFRSGG